MLMLSGIQHFRFCPRQWALMHKRVDDPFYRQKCGEFISLRSVNIASRELGLYGITDVVELHPTEDTSNSIQHPSYPGLWLPYPIEYKHGHPKRNQVDEVQLAAQTMCLEEQYCITIPYGAFYYAEIRHRLEVEISSELRSIVRDCAERMHKVFKEGMLPPIALGKHCEKCSLNNLCMPQSSKCTKVSYYLEKYLYEETS